MMHLECQAKDFKRPLEEFEAGNDADACLRKLTLVPTWTGWRG